MPSSPTRTTTCSACGRTHASPAGWIGAYRGGDSRLALEVLLTDWLEPVSVPPLDHRHLGEVLGVVGPALEPVLRDRHLRPPMPDGQGGWRFAFENQFIWEAVVDQNDLVAVRYRNDPSGERHCSKLGDFLLNFVLCELAVGLPVGQTIELGERAHADFAAVAIWPLPPWITDSPGEADSLSGAADGVVVTLLASEDDAKQRWPTLATVGGRCSRAVGRIVEAMEAIHLKRPTKRSRRRFVRKTPIPGPPWHSR